MFAPQGYINFADFLDRARGFARRTWASMPENCYFEEPPFEEPPNDDERRHKIRAFVFSINIIAGIVMC